MKRGFMRQFVKAMPTDGECFMCPINAFPGLSVEKIKASVFDGPQTQQLVKDDQIILERQCQNLRKILG